MSPLDVSSLSGVDPPVGVRDREKGRGSSMWKTCVGKKSYKLHDKTCFCGDAFAPLEEEMVLPCTRPTFSPWVVLPKADC